MARCLVGGVSQVPHLPDLPPGRYRIGGVRFVDGHDLDGIRVVIAHPSPEQQPRSMLDPHFYS